MDEQRMIKPDEAAIVISDTTLRFVVPEPVNDTDTMPAHAIVAYALLQLFVDMEPDFQAILQKKVESLESVETPDVPGV